LFVADEVICGFGRTGAVVWQRLLRQRPAHDDHIAKGLTSGYIHGWAGCA
jgi:adenosylmethionine-8-amino-7-oxononanoate aminotransferase